MTSAALAGSTGLVGGNILSVLAASPTISAVHAFARRDLPTTSPKLTALKSADSAEWPSMYPANTPLFLSALGTTKAQAGSVANQRKIDFDLNLELAKAAKNAGATTCVLISTSGANAQSSFAYPRMKGELEDAVRKLDFEHTVILRPGLIVGTREDSRPPEYAFRKIAGLFGAISSAWLKDPWAQDADVIAKAAVSAGLQCVGGTTDRKVWELTQSEIVKLGRDEWKASM
ncbi:hypothetical protein AAFC00_006329 [Neodothiora populina]|uniref:Uncharacterized protein n=1 Tax=Neodothiora populina TaxID=2781224 RepID=A0ABR3P4T6_9PEZI